MQFSTTEKSRMLTSCCHRCRPLRERSPKRKFFGLSSTQASTFPQSVQVFLFQPWNCSSFVCWLCSQRSCQANILDIFQILACFSGSQNNSFTFVWFLKSLFFLFPFNDYQTPLIINPSQNPMTIVQDNQCIFVWSNMFNIVPFMRDGWRCQNGWISEKFQRGGGSFSIQKFVSQILDL